MTNKLWAELPFWNTTEARGRPECPREKDTLLTPSRLCPFLAPGRCPRGHSDPLHALFGEELWLRNNNEWEGYVNLRNVLLITQAKREIK